MKQSPMKLRYLARLLRHFRRGQNDREAGRPCAETNGVYLDGWYAPKVHLPDFLTADLYSQVMEVLQDDHDTRTSVP